MRAPYGPIVASAFRHDEPTRRARQNADQFAVTETFPTGEQYGMAVTLENTNLADALNAALGNVQASGTYDEIYASWFGEG